MCYCRLDEYDISERLKKKTYNYIYMFIYNTETHIKKIIKNKINIKSRLH